jgi:hypothetical protein
MRQGGVLILVHEQGELGHGHEAGDELAADRDVLVDLDDLSLLGEKPTFPADQPMRNFQLPVNWRWSWMYCSPSSTVPSRRFAEPPLFVVDTSRLSRDTHISQTFGDKQLRE